MLRCVSQPPGKKIGEGVFAHAEGELVTGAADQGGFLRFLGGKKSVSGVWPSQRVKKATKRKRGADDDDDSDRAFSSDCTAVELNVVEKAPVIDHIDVSDLSIECAMAIFQEHAVRSSNAARARRSVRPSTRLAGVFDD